MDIEINCGFLNVKPLFIIYPYLSASPLITHSKVILDVVKLRVSSLTYLSRSSEECRLEEITLIILDVRSCS
jgi:hypothetical protein